MPPFIGLIRWAFPCMREYYKVVSSRMRGRDLFTLPNLGGFAKPPGLDNQTGGQAFGLLDRIPSRSEYRKVTHCDIYTEKNEKKKTFYTLKKYFVFFTHMSAFNKLMLN